MTTAKREEFYRVAREFGELLGTLNRDDHEEIGLDWGQGDTTYNWICDWLFNGENIAYDKARKNE